MAGSETKPHLVVCHCCQPVLEWHLRGQTSSSVSSTSFEHHPNRDSLKDSSVTCCLCQIFWIRARLLLIDSAGYQVMATWRTSSVSRLELRTKGVENQAMPKVDLICEADALANAASWPYYWLSFTQRFEVVKGWVEDCQTNHTECADRNNVDFRPRRLIYVGPGESKKQNLVDFEMPPHPNGKNTLIPPFPPYTTLSHCWGPPSKRPLRLLSTNIHDLLKNIEWNDLPQNFKDAISITRLLGLEWIWIDSLCIVQDDSKDWEIQAAKMASIYAHSYLTLAAHDSPDSHAGFIRERRPSPSKYRASVNLPDSGCSGTPRTLLLHLVHQSATDRPGKDGPLSDTILSSRGWVLQELVLSKRTVHFTHSKLHWQCRECFRSEHSAKPTKGFMSIRSSGNVPPPLHKFTAESDHGLIHTEAQIWHSWVSDYSSRKLTYGTDRAPAFAGMIEHFRPHLGAPMLGLWEGMLVDDLQWWLHYPRDMTSLSQARSQSPFPSWSWLSVMGERSPEIKYSPLPFKDRIATLRVNEFTCSWDGPEFTSQLKSSRLMLSGIVQNARMVVENTDQKIVILAKMDGTTIIEKRFSPDFPTDCIDMEVALLHLYHLGKPAWLDVFLVLALVPGGKGPSAYRRIGQTVYSVLPGDTRIIEFDETSRRDIELV